MIVWSDGSIWSLSIAVEFHWLLQDESVRELDASHKWKQRRQVTFIPSKFESVSASEIH